MVCSFFGHRDTPSSVYPLLLEKATMLIQERSMDCFMVGNQGNFDAMVLKALRELKRNYPHIRYHVVLAYMPTKEQEIYCPAETLLPEGIETVPKRFALSWRNRWMVRASDMVISYVTHSWGGAAQFAEYAERQGKEVIHLADMQFLCNPSQRK